MMKKIIFNTAKEQFRKAFRKYKSQVKRAKNPRVGGEIGVEPYGLKKLSIKNAIKRTKFMDKAANKAAKRTIMIPMMTKKQREANQESISQSVRKFLKERIGRKKKGGVIRAKKGRFV